MSSTSPPCSIFPRRSSTTNNCWKDSPVRHEAAGKVPRRGGPAGRPGGNDARRKPWRARGDVITQQAERWRTDLIGWALTDGAASPGSLLGSDTKTAVRASTAAHE